jgi:hypothetical protein
MCFSHVIFIDWVRRSLSNPVGGKLCPIVKFILSAEGNMGHNPTELDKKKKRGGKNSYIRLKIQDKIYNE